MKTRLTEWVVATRNPGKLREMRALLGDLGLRLQSAAERGAPEVDEDGETLSANARKKALSAAAATGLPAVADDTGLEVEALGWAPGVRSARWAGPGCSYADNNRKLLDELERAPGAGRAARFRTVIALAVPRGGGAPPEVRCEVEGELRGTIARAPRGDGGFGYDPLFVPEGGERTLAEMSPEEKNRISHRACALAALRAALAQAPVG